MEDNVEEILLNESQTQCKKGAKSLFIPSNTTTRRLHCKRAFSDFINPLYFDLWAFFSLSSTCTCSVNVLWIRNRIRIIRLKCPPFHAPHKGHPVCVCSCIQIYLSPVLLLLPLTVRVISWSISAPYTSSPFAEQMKGIINCYYVRSWSWQLNYSFCPTFHPVIKRGSP